MSRKIWWPVRLRRSKELYLRFWKEVRTFATLPRRRLGLVVHLVAPLLDDRDFRSGEDPVQVKCNISFLRIPLAEFKGLKYRLDSRSFLRISVPVGPAAVDSEVPWCLEH
ncbi:uncharacterized protein EV420DRAFT_1746731 [Desarmillaria tabescens]|uniref:Uncharacterized protein n=1 Tax=Armillaria tabescens TaxID=1929756 RepID=A0AA39N7F9_ARMTA|nr:uncharacterized protein EV420DRAFT_1746731 [Desarmillaria tabescens]KAK0460429.1 hypothetical protein EV420DRAFT_1746731 [Desarmillaria tabescens]